MDRLSNKIKRKKRKTRKSLNELRKRISEKLDKNSSTNSVFNLYDSQKNINLKHNYVGTNRLTLGLFHKAIQSETITRPALSKIRDLTTVNVNSVLNKQTSIKKINLSQQTSNTFSNDKYSCSSDDNDSDRDKYKMTKVFSNTISSTSNMQNENYINMLNSPILFSPVNFQMTGSLKFEESENQKTISLSTSSSESLQLDDNYHLYEDFIKSIPKYLIEEKPALIKHDVMHQTKVFLHNQYLNDCHRETEDNIVQSIQKKNKRSSQNRHTQEEIYAKKNIEENPINYISLRHTRQHSGSCKAIRSISSTSPNSPLDIMNTSNASRLLDHDTPEYIYFPHKLNH